MLLVAAPTPRRDPRVARRYSFDDATARLRRGDESVSSPALGAGVGDTRGAMEIFLLEKDAAPPHFTAPLRRTRETPTRRRLLPPGLEAGAEVGLGPGGEDDGVGLVDLGVREGEGEGAGRGSPYPRCCTGRIRGALELVLSLVPGHDAAKVSAHSVDAVLLDGAVVLDDDARRRHPAMASSAGEAEVSGRARMEIEPSSRGCQLAGLSTAGGRKSNRSLRPYPRDASGARDANAPGKGQNARSAHSFGRAHRSRAVSHRSGRSPRARTLRPWDRVWSPGRWVLSHSLDLMSAPVASLAAWPARAAAAAAKEGVEKGRERQRGINTGAGRRDRGSTQSIAQQSNIQREAGKTPADWTLGGGTGGAADATRRETHPGGTKK